MTFPVGPKCYGLRFMPSEAQMAEPAQEPQSMEETMLNVSVPIATRALHRNISTFAAVLSRHYVQGTLTPKCVDNRVVACYPIVNALEYELSNNEVTQHADGPTTMPEQDWAAFRTPQPNLELPAAIQWLSILGSALYDGIANSIHSAGPLWTSLGGSEEVTMERWSFWRRRLREFSETDTILGNGIKESCRQAANRMEGGFC